MKKTIGILVIVACCLLFVGGVLKADAETDFSYIPVADGYALIYTADEFSYLSNVWKNGNKVFLFDAESFSYKLFDVRLLDFMLMANIDAVGVEIKPLGTESVPFEGRLCGNGYSLTMQGGLIQYGKGCDLENVVIKGALPYVIHSLFKADNSVIRNVSIEGSLSGSPFAEIDGSIVFENVSVKGRLESESNVGGVIGVCQSAVIKNCSVELTIKAENAGGFIYKAADASIEGGNLNVDIIAQSCGGAIYDCENAKLLNVKNFVVSIHCVEPYYLIKEAENVCLKNVVLKNVTTSAIGSVVALSAENVAISTNVTTTKNFGAFALSVVDGDFYNCKVTGRIAGKAVGGFVMSATVFDATKCISDVEILGTELVGGYVCTANRITMNDCIQNGFLKGVGGGISAACIFAEIEGCSLRSNSESNAFFNTIEQCGIKNCTVFGCDYLFGFLFIKGDIKLKNVVSDSAFSKSVTFIEKNCEISVENCDFTLTDTFIDSVNLKEGCALRIKESTFDVDIEREETASALVSKARGNAFIELTDNVFCGSLKALSVALIIGNTQNCVGKINENLICIVAEGAEIKSFTKNNSAFEITGNYYCSENYGDIPGGNETGVVLKSLSAIYDGAPKYPEIFTSVAISIRYTQNGVDVSPVNAGEYIIKVKGEREFSFVYTILKNEIIVEKNYELDYTGKELFLPLSGAVFTQNGEAVPLVEAGTYDYTCIVEGKNNDYLYKGAVMVNKAYLPVGYKPHFEFSVSEKVYDGKPLDLKVQSEVGGVEWYVRYRSGNSYQDEIPTLPGSYTAVLYMDISKSYADEPSSNVAEEFKFVIKKIEVMISADNASRRYGDADNAFSYSISGISKKEYCKVKNYNSVVISYNGEYPGEYVLKIKGYALSEIYDFSYINGKMEILKALRASPTEKMFSLETENRTIMVSTDNPYLEFSLDGVNYEQTEFFKNLEIGEYTLFVRYAETKYYEKSQPLEVIVTVENNLFSETWFIILAIVVAFCVTATIFVIKGKKKKRVERKEWRKG